MASFRISVLVAFCASFLFAFGALHAQDAETPQADPALVASLELPSPEDVEIISDDLNILLLPMTAVDLSALADVWQGHLKNALEEIARSNIALKTAESDAEEDLRDQIASRIDDLGAIRESYSGVLNAWQAKGGSEEELQPHRDYVGAVTAASLQTTDARTLLSVAWQWVTSWEGGLGFVLQVLGFILAIWAMMFIARMVQRLSNRGLAKIPHLSHLLQSFISRATYWATLVLGVLVVLGFFGVNVTPLFAVFGGLSFILGFALQDTLGNLASGLMIMILKPFDTGDYIQIGTSSGFVDEMSVVSTRIRTFDNQIIVVPNSKIWGDIITNVSASAERRVDLVFGIAYSDNAAHAIRVLSELVETHPMCLGDPPPEIFVGELGDSSVNIFCRPWCKSDDYWTVYWDLTGQAKERFDFEGISIPFPQRDVHLFNESVSTNSL